MIVQTFTKDNFFDIDAMHDCYISQFSIEDKTLVITYDNLDEGPVDPNGEPIYKHKKLVVRYEFETFCDVIWYGKRKRGIIDFYKKPEEFYRLFKDYIFLNYKYAIDCFKEVSLHITPYKLKKRSKLFEIEIHMDTKTITYTWE